MGRLFALLFTVSAILVCGSLLGAELLEIGERAGHTEFGSLSELADCALR